MSKNTKNSFKIGEIVQLKSGGPKMTISRIKKNEIETMYFMNQETDKATVTKNLRPEMLKQISAA